MDTLLRFLAALLSESVVFVQDGSTPLHQVTGKLLVDFECKRRSVIKGDE